MRADEEFEDNATESHQSTMPGVGELIWRRKSTLIFCIVAGLVISIFVYLQSTPAYSSAAQVLIVQKAPDVLPSSSSGDDRRFAFVGDSINTQVKLISSPRVVSQAVERLKQEGISSLPADSEQAVATIIGGLSVEADKDNSPYAQSGVVNIAYRGPDALDAQKIVSAVIIAYQLFLEQAYQSNAKQAVEIIETAQESIGTQLKEIQDQYNTFRSKNPPVINTEAGLSTSANKLSTLETKIAEYQLQKSQLSYQIGIILKGWLFATPPELVLDELRIDNKLTHPLETQLLGYQAELNQLRKSYGEEYNRIVELKDLIKLYQKAMGGQPGVDDQSNEPGDVLQRTFTALVRDMQSIQRSLSLTNELIEKATETVVMEKELAYKHQRYNDEIDALLEYLKVLRDKLQQINLLADSGGYTAEPITPPSLGRKVAPKLTQTLILGCLLGAMVGFGLAYLTEMSDKRFHSPDQIRKLLSLPVIGHLPSMKPDAKTLAAIASSSGPPLDSTLLTYHKSRSPMAEAFRGIRTAVHFGLSTKNHKIIQMTSPMKGDGKSTTAANLAVSFAQTGTRTLLIDADMRRPQVHKLFGLKPTLGLEDVLLGNKTPQEAMLPSGVENLTLLANGTRPVNPAELLTSPQFKDLLDNLRNDYDLIIVDTPPVLLVSDPAIVASRGIDGLLMVVRVGKSTKAEALRARNILTELDINILGILVNIVDGGTKEGEYGTGYSYGYNYNYEYDAKSYGSEYGYGYEDSHAENAENVERT